MAKLQIRRVIGMGLLLACVASAQDAPKKLPKTLVAKDQELVAVQEPDADRSRNELNDLLGRYPPSLRAVLQEDPSLLSNNDYLKPYPGLVSFLSTHPEVIRDPAYFVGRPNTRFQNYQDPNELTRNMLSDLSVFAGFGMAIGLITWLIRTLVDYRRWSRLEKVQTDVHTKLLDRFSANDELLAYIQSPAGSKFLESSPITLDAGPRSVGAPLGRILWSLQAGVVAVAGGVGLMFLSGRVPEDGETVSGLGILAIALGCGFVVSAILSFGISHRLGLIEKRTAPAGPSGIVQG